MASVTSNLPQVELLLDQLSDGLDFPASGQEKALGLEMAELRQPFDFGAHAAGRYDTIMATPGKSVPCF